MSVYNGRRFLREAIESILTQTMTEFEFIIINDGSIDDTAAILASYDDRRLRIIHQENTGLAVSLNRGLEMARTELVARMDADDIALPNRLETQLKEYERLGRPDVLGGYVEYICESGYSLGTRRCPLTHQDIIDELERGRVAIFHPTVLYKRDSVLQQGGYDPFFRYSTEDYDLWLRMSVNCRFASISQILLKLRLNSSSMESQILKCKIPSRTSSSWYVCVARQRHLLEKEEAGHLWENPETREQILDLLWSRVAKCGLHQSILANRALAFIQADLKTWRHRVRGLRRAVQLCLSHPSSTTRYLITRKHPEPVFIKAQEILQG